MYGNKKIKVYMDWFLQDCSDQKSEIEWLVNSMLNSIHKEDMEQVLKDTYELYKSNYNN